jgi:anthranilate synthase/aminodeoxychorismate synthase-like glutamine amidotransferase
MGVHHRRVRALKSQTQRSTGEKAEVILLLDNYDSFTYNLAQYLGELGCEVEVHRNDKISVDEIARRKPERIVISPGPCTPQEAGISMELVSQLAGKFPILGVCLGHQAIGAAFGGKIKRAPQLFHGKTSEIHHDNQGVFRDLADPFTATRYHSLIVERKSLPPELVITAETVDGIIMGLRHRRHKTEGVQFHPESVLTESGKQLLKNFLEL